MAQDFRPEIVATVMDNFSYYKHAWNLSRRLRARLVTITMDDPQMFEEAHPYFNGAYDRAVQQIYSDSALSLGVSREMCDYLAQRFGKPSTTFYFGPPDNLKIRPAETSAQLKKAGCLTLAYAGSLGLGYREGILALLGALETSGTQLQIYSHYKNPIDHPNVTYRGFLPPDKLWPAIQRECDAVLLPYAYEGEYLRLYRTHFPTKLSEYCWTGMPLVLSGPEFATGVRWGRSHEDAAWVITDPSTTASSGVFQQIREQSEIRVGKARASSRLALHDFEPVRIRTRFVELLRNAAKEPLPAKR